MNIKYISFVDFFGSLKDKVFDSAVVAKIDIDKLAPREKEIYDEWKNPKSTSLLEIITAREPEIIIEIFHSDEGGYSLKREFHGDIDFNAIELFDTEKKATANFYRQLRNYKSVFFKGLFK